MGSVITQGLPIVNAVAFIGATITSLFAYSCTSSRPRLISFIAGFGTLFATIGLVFDIIFLTNSDGINSAGTGFWLTVIAIGILGPFAACTGCRSCGKTAQKGVEEAAQPSAAEQAQMQNLQMQQQLQMQAALAQAAQQGEPPGKKNNKKK
jgi:ABC-type nickel/cobalt efflux system permease component RcnA